MLVHVSNIRLGEGLIGLSDGDSGERSIVVRLLVKVMACLLKDGLAHASSVAIV